jgi:DNA invertase Pin-like site-specific DNA recombinase
MPPPCPLALSPVISLVFALVWKFALPLILIVAVVDVLTQSQPQRIRRLYRSGFSQRSIASRLGISRYQVRTALV